MFSRLTTLICLLYLMLPFVSEAHTFGPVEGYTFNTGGFTQVQMTLYSKQGGYYYFTIGDKVMMNKTGTEPNLQYVVAGMPAYFPLTINNKYVVNNHIMICSTEARKDVRYSQEVCFNVRVIQ